MERGAGDTRNMILAVVLSIVVLIGFEYFLARPQRERDIAEQRAAAAAQQMQEEAGITPVEDVAPETAVARTQGGRIPIETGTVDGTLSLSGPLFDDLMLRDYRTTLDEGAPEVRLLSPDGARGAASANFGWEVNGGGLIDEGQGVWTAPAGARLTPQTPVTLTMSAGGFTVTRTISVDERYMFTIEDRVRNDGDAAREVRPFGIVRRDGRPPDFVNNGIVHQGMTGVFGPEHRLKETRYQRAETHARNKDRGRRGPDERIVDMTGQGGWLGLSDHYWLAALVPDQSETVNGWYDSRNRDGQTIFGAAYRGAWHAVQPGEEITYTQRLFAGAKVNEILVEYENELNIPDFDKAIDWGNFWFLTRPFFMLLHFFGQLAGNFGWGILLTTIVVKLLLFPLVYQSNVAMTKMRKLQPKMKEIQERYASDKQRMQQEQIRLFQTEKVNPLAGCLPILLQIPVFFALYKVLTVTIEMRHAPFIGWIEDLSARDPTNVFNLFGLLPAIGIPFHPETWPVVGPFLWLGLLPILYGVTMYALQALSPPPTDPTQATIFKFLPILFTFLFAGFAVGMVIYWTWSNILSILQQYVIMRRMGVDTELDKWIAKRWGKKDESAVAK